MNLLHLASLAAESTEAAEGGGIAGTVAVSLLVGAVIRHRLLRGRPRSHRRREDAR